MVLFDNEFFNFVLGDVRKTMDSLTGNILGPTFPSAPTEGDFTDRLNQQFRTLRSPTSLASNAGAGPSGAPSGAGGLIPLRGGRPPGESTFQVPDLSTLPLAALARQIATETGIDPERFVRQIYRESKFDPNAVSPRGAKGLGQIMSEYHPELTDPFNPESNLRYAAKHYKSLLDRYGGDESLALAAYNAGAGAVARYQGIPPYKETQTYVRDILGNPTPLPQASQDPNKVIELARLELGKPYAGPLAGLSAASRFGDPGWDCSSFVAGVYKQLGYNLTPFTDAIANETDQISFQEAQPGDIILYRYRDDTQRGVKYPHMAIYLGDGQMIDASYQRGVTIRAMLQVPFEMRRVRPLPPAPTIPGAA